MISKDKFVEMVRESLSVVMDVDEITIANDETFEDYGVDSLDRMNLLLELEGHLGRELQEVDMVKTNTIDLLYDYISKIG